MQGKYSLTNGTLAGSKHPLAIMGSPTMAAWCWGNDVIDAKTRSMMNLSMIGALEKMNEWEIHCRGAINNGVSHDEIRYQAYLIYGSAF